jgi:hypothetical protein
MRRRLLPVDSEVWLRFGSVERLERTAGGSSCVCCLVRRSLESCRGLAGLLCSVFWNGAIVPKEFWSDRRSLTDVIVSRSLYVSGEPVRIMRLSAREHEVLPGGTWLGTYCMPVSNCSCDRSMLK